MPARTAAARVAILALLAAPLFGQTAPSADPADALLERLRLAGDEMKSLRANVAITETDPITARDTTRSGKVWIERRGEGDTRGRVVFDQRITGDELYRDREEYLLDGDWVIDRVYRRPGDATGGNRETHRQLRKPGTKTDLFKLGAGAPFPLPIGQAIDAVHQEFNVQLLPPDAEKPKMKGVRLSPKKTSDLHDRFASIDVWIADDQKMPSIITTEKPDNGGSQTTTLTDVAFNAKLSDADFKMEPIDPKVWTIEREPYKGD